MLYMVNINNIEISQQCSVSGHHECVTGFLTMRFSKLFITQMNIGTRSTDMTEMPKVNKHFTCLTGRLSSLVSTRAEKSSHCFYFLLLPWINRGEVTSRQTHMRKQLCVSTYMSAFWQKKKFNNQLLNTWMPLQNNSWLYKNTSVMFKTQYQTRPMNCMNKKVQYIQILI